MPVYVKAEPYNSRGGLMQSFSSYHEAVKAKDTWVREGYTNARIVLSVLQRIKMFFGADP